MVSSEDSFISSCSNNNNNVHQQHDHHASMNNNSSNISSNMEGSNNSNSSCFRRSINYPSSKNDNKVASASKTSFPSSKTSKRHLAFTEIPEHLRFNKYVRGYYRPPTNWIGCLKSLFYFHNETINVLTHAIPFVAIGILVPSYLPYDEITVPYLPTFHVLASMAPWLGSTFYHLFMNHQHGYPMYKLLLTLDLIGIWVTQVTGGLVTICATIYCLSSDAQQNFLIFYGFLCLYSLYKAMTAKCVWSRRFSFTAPFVVRMVMVLLRAVGLGAGDPRSFPHVILQDAIAVAGAIVGATNIPERWFPGKLDLIFNSHHLMHVMVVYAVYEMHQATVMDLKWMSHVNANSTECPNHLGNLWQSIGDQLWNVVS